MCRVEEKKRFCRKPACKPLFPLGILHNAICLIYLVKVTWACACLLERKREHLYQDKHTPKCQNKIIIKKIHYFNTKILFL